MALLTKAPRGTQDFTPDVTPKWQYVESTLLQTAKLFGFAETRTPIFEHTELFTRSVGDTTDVVQKEMYTFTDKKDRSITLKPEGTAGALRAAIEHGLLSAALPLKLSYVTPCFRYEKAQAGRYRQFHQFGVELLGSASPVADAETIALVNECLGVLGVKDIALEINSIGCPKCRPAYQQALVKYFEGHREDLCPTCLERLEKNPLRLLDCKVERCQEIAKDAPSGLDYLCQECSDHFAGLKRRLDSMDIAYRVNDRIVRGLDYYTKTVFEFVSQHIGAQGTVCGGGRYDGLVELLGGPPTPGIGFAMGIERLLMVMQTSSAEFPAPTLCDLYIAAMGEEASVQAGKMVMELRSEGFWAETDSMNRSLKSQLKYADKLGAKFSMVLGEAELSSRKALIKDMRSGRVVEVTFEDYVEKLTQSVFENYYVEILESQQGTALQPGEMN